MAIEYDYDVDGRLLSITAKGTDDNLEEVGNYARAVLGLSMKNNCNQIICDERELEYTLSTLDTFTLAESASREARNLDKIAIVCQQKQLRDGKFYETVSTNRGLSVFVTSSKDQAMEWLKSK